MDSTILILLAALLLHSCDGGPVRMRRRAKPKGAQLHNLEQLQHEVSKVCLLCVSIKTMHK